MGGILCGTVQQEYGIDHDPINDRYTRRKRQTDSSKEVGEQLFNICLIYHSNI